MRNFGQWALQYHNPVREHPIATLGEKAIQKSAQRSDETKSLQEIKVEKPHTIRDLENFLKNNQNQSTIDLSWYKGSRSLLQVIKNDDPVCILEQHVPYTTQVLNLSGWNFLQLDDWSKLFHWLGTLPKLERLVLNDCGEFHAPALECFMNRWPPQLKYLEMEGCRFLSCRSFDPLLKNLKKTHLEFLSLSGCEDLSDDLLKQLVAGLPKSLKHLWLEGLTDIRTETYGDLFNDMAFSDHLVGIGIGNSLDACDDWQGIRNETLAIWGFYFPENLKRVSLQCSGQIANEGLKPFAETLKERPLEMLELTGLGKVDKNGYAHFISHLSSSLEILTLDATGMEDETICELFDHIPKLKHLQLENCEKLTNASCYVLIELLKKHPLESVTILSAPQWLPEDCEQLIDEVKRFNVKVDIIQNT